MDLAVRVIELAVEPQAFTPCDDAIGFGRGFVSPNLRFVSFNPRGFATGNRTVFQTIGDAVLLILLALINARSFRFTVLRRYHRANPNRSDQSERRHMDL